jgi:putative nucleotidyltransferase with HDIG domain
VSAALGSVAWATPRRGRLTFGEKLRVIGQGIKVTLRGGGRGAALGPGELPLVDELAVPDGEHARWAQAACAAVAAPWLVHHCLRTYAWGTLIARRDGVRCDAELLWVGALLHDLGVTDAHRAPAGTCFAFHGATVARDLLTGRGVDDTRAARVAEAICQHLNVIANAGAEPEVRYLAAGAAFDTAGMRRADVEAAARQRVDDAYPRLGMKREFAAVMRERSRVESGTRMVLLCRLGFLGRIKRAPFSE